jgi:hypothetical protein
MEKEGMKRENIESSISWRARASRRALIHYSTIFFLEFPLLYKKAHNNLAWRWLLRLIWVVLVVDFFEDVQIGVVAGWSLVVVGVIIDEFYGWFTAIGKVFIVVVLESSFDVHRVAEIRYINCTYFYIYRVYLILKVHIWWY